MWWGIEIGAGILYFIVAFTLGLLTLRKPQATAAAV
jgi:hypothetical protein